MIVIDASALLAFLFREPGGELVAGELGGAVSVMSAVNYSEVVGRFARDGHGVNDVEAALTRLPVRVVDFDRRLAVRAAALTPVARPLGLSLGDRACLALGQSLDVPVLTADRAWLALEDIDRLVVRCIR